MITSMAKPIPAIAQYSDSFNSLNSSLSSILKLASVETPQILCRQAPSLKPGSTSTPGAFVASKFRSFATQRSVGLQRKSGLRLAGDIMCRTSNEHDFSPALEVDLEEAISRQIDASLMLASRLIATEAKDRNFVCSPVSINLLLSLLASGSKGHTLDELLAFLKSKDIDELNKCVNEIVGHLLADGDGIGAPKITVANGIWVDESMRIQEKFEQVVHMVYKGNVKQVNFRTKNEEVERDVNLWAEEKTNGLIKNILPPYSVHTMTRFILANAVYFKGSWIEEFEALRTEDLPFHLPSGVDVNVPFMTSWTNQYVAQFDGFKVLGLPYRNGMNNKCRRDFSMYIFLPDATDGLPALAENWVRDQLS